MEIKDFLVAADTLIGLRAPDKTRLLQDLSARAAASVGLNAGEIGQAILAREALGSTGTGGGVAIPHARVAGLKKPFGTLACIKRPVAFDAIDSQPVDVVFLLLLPVDPDPEHLSALASVARALRDPDLVRRLRHARDGAEAYAGLVGKGSAK
jgi:PTS system nitrogen regulatory IIA component